MPCVRQKETTFKGVRCRAFLLLVLATLILVNHLIACATARVLLNKDVIHKALENVKFSTVDVMHDEEKMTLAEYIRREYVTDPAVTTGDVEAVLNQMNLEALAMRKLDNYQNYYRGRKIRWRPLRPRRSWIYSTRIRQ